MAAVGTLKIAENNQGHGRVGRAEGIALFRKSTKCFGEWTVVEIPEGAGHDAPAVGRNVVVAIDFAVAAGEVDGNVEKARGKAGFGLVNGEFHGGNVAFGITQEGFPLGVVDFWRDG